MVAPHVLRLMRPKIWPWRLSKRMKSQLVTFLLFSWFSAFMILGEVDGLDMMNQNELDAEMDMAMNAGGYS